MRTITVGGRAATWVGVLVVLAFVAVPRPTAGTQDDGPARDTIVYSTLAPGNWDLFLFDGPGATPRRLTSDPGLDYNPAVSPDGRWVVFTSERIGNPDLYALDLRDGGPPIRLTRSTAMEDAAAFTPDGRTLVFVSTRSGNPDIFSMPFVPASPHAAADATNLTAHDAGDYQPAVSPDGTRILFSSSRDAVAPESAAATGDQSELYVMSIDGTGVQRLTSQPGWDGSPTWSPDGDAAIFYTERDGQPRIYRLTFDGAPPQPVSAAEAAALSPTAAGDRIAFTWRGADRWAIVSTRLDGTDVRQESDDARDYWAPVYDPVSGRLVAHGPGPADDASHFVSDVPGPFRVHPPMPFDLPGAPVALTGVRGYLPTLDRRTGDVASSEAFVRLVVTRPDGTARRVVADPGHPIGYRGVESPWGPAWSHDGEWLAFGVGMPFGGPTDDVDIWKARPDGSDATNLTPDSDANDAMPDFSPDGSRVVFRSMRDGNAEIYLMNADGTNVRRLTDHPATDTMPAFSSAGNRIAFTSLRDDDYEIYLLTLDADGMPGRLERLTHSAGRDMHPRFSPDDQWLLFTSERGRLNDELPLVRVLFQPQPYGELHAMRLADRHVVRITHNKWEDGPAAWIRP